MGQAPPSLEECEDYGVWNKLYACQAVTGYTDMQQAVSIIQMIQDDHKYHEKNLQTLMMKTFTAE